MLHQAGHVNADNVTAFEQDEAVYNALMGIAPTIGEKQGSSGGMKDMGGVIISIVTIGLILAGVLFAALKH